VTIVRPTKYIRHLNNKSIFILTSSRYLFTTLYCQLWLHVKTFYTTPLQKVLQFRFFKKIITNYSLFPCFTSSDSFSWRSSRHYWQRALPASSGYLK
jgi:hypothetical protein